MSRRSKKRVKTEPLKGGLGGVPPTITQPVKAELIDDRTPGKDIKLINSAVNKGWIIREQAMQALPDAMLSIALRPDSEPRARVAAAKVLCTMYGQNRPTDGGTTVNVGVVVNNGEDLLD